MRDLKDLLEEGVDEDPDFLHVCDGGIQGFCSIELYWLHDGFEEPDLCVDAYRTGSPDSLHHCCVL